MQPMGGAMHAEAAAEAAKAAAAPMQPMDQPGAMHVDPMGATTAPMDTQTAAMTGGEQVMAA